MKKIFLTLVCLMALTVYAQEYIDLGLPSGTLWMSENEDGYYTYDQALINFGKSLPTKKQIEELVNVCQWLWTGREYVITGPNGKSIILPAAGYRLYYKKSVRHIGSTGIYWTSTFDDTEHAYSLYITQHSTEIIDGFRTNSGSVRLVQAK